MTNKTKKRLGVVAAMLGLVVAIGATAGNTLAKYISSVKVESQTATVAKWGYTLTGTNELFATNYGDVDEATKLATKVENDGVVIKGTSEGNIVAPGTTGNMTLTFKGNAEVNAILTIDVSEFETIYLSNNAENTNAYYPIKWAATLGGADTLKYGDDANCTDGASLVDVIADAFDEGLAAAKLDWYKAEYTVTVVDEKVEVRLPANANMESTDIELTIAWKWDFETEKTAAAGETDATYYNAEDTLLGYLAAGTAYADLLNINELSSLFKAKSGFTAYVENSNTRVSVGFVASIAQTQEDILAEVKGN